MSLYQVLQTIPISRNKYNVPLRKYLNEVVTPSPNLSVGDTFDQRVYEAVIKFQHQFNRKHPERKPQLMVNGTPDPVTWAAIGVALGAARLKQEIAASQDQVLNRMLQGIPLIDPPPSYTTAMQECDKKLAELFSDSGASASAHGHVPKENAVEGGYRGDYRDLMTGRIIAGHLSSYAMHLHGSRDGTKDTGIYVPLGYERPEKAARQTPTPTDAVVTFYYKKRGTLPNATLAVFHVANFKPEQVGDRIRIGTTGGLGGKHPKNRHAHIEIYNGDVGLPPTLKDRAKVRVTKFGEVFCN